MALHPTVGIATVKELIGYARAHPGKLDYGSSGTGGSVHLATEFFSQSAGINMTHVPYKGQGPALSDLLGGQIQLFSGSPMVIYPHMKSNRLRGIGITGATRSKAMPEIPAIAETVAGFETYSWRAGVGPKGLSKDITARWNQALNRLLELPRDERAHAGDPMEVAGGPPERFLEILRSDVGKWRKVVKAANIKLR